MCFQLLASVFLSAGAERVCRCYTAVSQSTFQRCVFMPGRPLLILCFSPDKIPGVSMMLMLSRTGFGIWAHMNLDEGNMERKEGNKKDRWVLEQKPREQINISNQSVFIYTLSIRRFSGRFFSKCNAPGGNKIPSKNTTPPLVDRKMDFILCLDQL